MKFLHPTAIRYALFLCALISISRSYTQRSVGNFDFPDSDKTSLIIKDGQLVIDLTNSSETTASNVSNSSTVSNTNENLASRRSGLDAFPMASTLTKNLSSSATPTLTTNVSVKIMQRVWKVDENETQINSVNLRLQHNTSEPNQKRGKYYMFISETEEFDDMSDFRILRSDENGNLKTEYDFDGSSYITFGYSPQLRFERSVSFDGTDDYIDMDNALDLNPSGFTISAWVKRDSDNFGKISIVSKRDEAFTKGYDLRLLSTNNIEIIWKTNSEQSLISNTALPYDEWHHIAAIYNGTEVSLYIDGVRDKVESKTATLSTNELFYIGAAGTNAPTQYFSGAIDEVRIWDVALSENQLRFIMNQEIAKNSGQVIGKILPTAIAKNDIDTIPWSALAGYYPMSGYTYSSTTDDSGNGIHGVLRNINTVATQTAPLPYTSSQNGNWDEKSTWVNGHLQYIPGAASLVDPNITIDWNIVKTSHNVTMTNSNLPIEKNENRRLLGLYIDANALILDGDTNLGEGTGLNISHYLSLNGKIDLEGESQLIQDLDSDLDVSPSGVLERDQQGPADTYTYKYWSSPVGTTDIAKNDYSYAVRDVMYDDIHPINFITSSYNGAATDPIGIADYWIWKYANHPVNDYSSWQHIRRNGAINAGEGFTMKGPGTGTILTDQNYVFLGKPNNGDINLTIHSGNDYLLGNPYPSTLDANQFIIDNGSSETDTSQKISGTLYFWEHWAGGTHGSNVFQGGYAMYNLSGGVPAASYGTNDPSIATGGTPTKIPGPYIPIGQGFFVLGKHTGTINFNNGQRVFRKERGSDALPSEDDATSQFQDNPSSDESDDRMKFRLGFNSINTIHRQLLLTIDENTSIDVDWAYDGKHNENQMDDMYWMINEDPYIIQGSNQAELTSVYPIGIKTTTDGLNSITIDALENVPSSLNIYVHDTELDLYHNLRQSDYEVFLNAGLYNNRFEITFGTDSDTLGYADETRATIDIRYSNAIEKIILINPSHTEIKSMALFNILGQSVYTIKVNTALSYSEYEVKDLSSGTYIVQLHTDNGSVMTKKVLVK